MGQPNIQIPVFDVRSEDGTEKRLHRNHLFLLGFIDNKTEDENKGDGEDGKEEDLDNKNHGKEDRKDEENEIDVHLEDGNPHTDDTKEPEAEVEEGATGGILPRRSTREKEKLKQFDSYIMHQVTIRPVDRQLQTLLGSGVFNQLDSDMTTSILDAVMK